MPASRSLRRVTPGSTIPALADRTPTASADAPSENGAPARVGSPRSAVDHVANFYGAYTDALHDTGRGQLAGALRLRYLTPTLRRRLTQWEANHHQDGVLRAQGVPSRWSVAHRDSGLGHCWSVVTLTWDEKGQPARRTRLRIRSDLATRLISGIWIDE